MSFYYAFVFFRRVAHADTKEKEKALKVRRYNRSRRCELQVGRKKEKENAEEIFGCVSVPLHLRWSTPSGHRSVASMGGMQLRCCIPAASPIPPLHHHRYHLGRSAWCCNGRTLLSPLCSDAVFLITGKLTETTGANAKKSACSFLSFLLLQVPYLIAIPHTPHLCVNKSGEVCVRFSVCVCVEEGRGVLLLSHITTLACKGWGRGEEGINRHPSRPS
jgi:hypothetical protein